MFNISHNVEAVSFKRLIQSTTGHTVGEEVSLHVAPENIQIMSKPQSEDEEVAQDV